MDKQKNGIIFDLDGTLWDSGKEVVEAWNQVLAAYPELHKQITLEDMHGFMGKTMDHIARLVLPEENEETRTKILDECCAAENAYLKIHGGKLYPNLEDVFASLSERYHLYIVSNCQKGYIEAFLDYAKLWDYVEDTECYGNTLMEKGDSIRLLYDRNHLTQAVYVGDTQGDLDATDAAGLPFIHAAYGFGTTNRETTAIMSLSELPKAVLEILG